MAGFILSGALLYHPLHSPSAKPDGVGTDKPTDLHASSSTVGTPKGVSDFRGQGVGHERL